MSDYIPGFALHVYRNAWLAFVLYWLPMMFCALGYLFRTARNIINDRNARVTPGGYYRPTDTIGSLMGRAIMTLLPIGNIMAALFDLSPEVFARFFKLLREVFNQPLVPDFEDGRKLRGLDK